MARGWIAFVFALLSFSAASIAAQENGVSTAASNNPASPPAWAYGFATPATRAAAADTAAPVDAAAPAVTPAGGAPAAAPAAPVDTSLHTLRGTKLSFTRAQVSDRFGPADWFPQDHPAMPPIVAHGKAPDVMACALCHYPNGRGRPENAAVAGLTENYILQQLQHFRRDERHTADSRKTNTGLMVQIAKGMSDAEMQDAARYFSKLKFPRWIKVIETDTVPRTEISGGMFLPIANAGREPIGARIIEVPEDRTAVEELRNPRVGFIAYVPRGSIRRGEALVMRASGKTPLPCTTCHGPDLKGMLDIPPLAGRSPSYIVRELFDIQAGTRFGTGVDLMKPIVARLGPEDMLDIAAFLASRSP